VFFWVAEIASPKKAIDDLRVEKIEAFSDK
jgi:hypothetical protein